ncbi:volume-regulated anion channel subunit LRRC8E-like [Xenia sp. Carnegie-2017]|uniref:volume-regulated anion channel subunit LRRC8E-like n=1 Tax=Xenia sp. Carnegie-2017 TaxID=2897299 RepID=UPI001F037887|nr:volume-regulated anion channel subunit LRRC8E-like [Xenia sp. Carnegie-2017]
MLPMEYFWNKGKENLKILKPWWDVITDYLVILLVMLSVLVAGMEVTSGSFECVAVVNCPSASKPNLNASWLLADLKFPNTCKKFYESQNTSFVERTEVVTDHEVNIIYKSFVNSECSKSAIQDFLAYLWIVLFAEALWLFILDNFWLKFPLTCSVIETFVDLVMACYDSPCTNSTVTLALFQQRHNRTNSYRRVSNNDTSDLTDHYNNFDFLPDTTSTSALMGLYEKVQKLKKNISSSHFIEKISNLYTIKSVLQVLSVISFLVINYNYNDLKDKMTCTLPQHIPIPHDYFLCSHNLAPAMYYIVHIYNGVLAVGGVIFFFIVFWTVKLRRKNYEYIFSNKISPKIDDQLSDIDPVKEDLGFLLHLLHCYNKMYVIRFARFLSEENKKKIAVAHALNIRFPVAYLRVMLDKEEKLSFNTLPGIPRTIFDPMISENLLNLEFRNCYLEVNDFDNFQKLIRLKCLFIVECGLDLIPEKVFSMAWLEELHLNGNLIKKITDGISDLKSLSVLKVSDNNLEDIDPGSLSKLENLKSLDISHNSNLKMDALREVLQCKELQNLVCPSHLMDRATLDKLNDNEQERLLNLTQPD